MCKLASVKGQLSLTSMDLLYFLLFYRVVIEEAVSKFLDAHNLAGSIPRMKAKSLCGVGQGLRALSLHRSADAPTHWVVTEMVKFLLSVLCQLHFSLRSKLYLRLFLLSNNKLFKFNFKHTFNQQVSKYIFREF